MKSNVFNVLQIQWMAIVQESMFLSHRATKRQKVKKSKRNWVTTSTLRLVDPLSARPFGTCHGMHLHMKKLKENGLHVDLGVPATDCFTEPGVDLSNCSSENVFDTHQNR